MIERKPLSGNPCISERGIPISCGETHTGEDTKDFVSEEHYAFSGQPLVFICRLAQGAGKRDGCGDEEHPGWTNVGGWRYFRLQVEGQFARFYLSPSRKYWRVQLKGGDLLEFGEPPGIGTPGIEHPADNSNGIIRWRLVKHSDAVHTTVGPSVDGLSPPVNYVLFRWGSLEGKRGLLYLTDIYDTPLAGGANDPLSFAHHTQLDWAPPDFPQTSYADAYRATPDLRLARVVVASMPWSGVRPREVIRAYELTYLPAKAATSADAPKQSPLWHHSFLRQIQMQGRCNKFEDDQGAIPNDLSCPKVFYGLYGKDFQSADVTGLPPTTFEYQLGNPVFGVANLSKVGGGPPNASEAKTVLPYIHSVGVVDFNRDGLPDIVQSWNSESCTYFDPETGDPVKGGTHVELDFNQELLVCRDGGGPSPFQSSRPIIGYLNRGLEAGGLSAKFSYQCMDTGTLFSPLVDGSSYLNTSSLIHYNISRLPGFFTDKGSATLVGLWSQGVAAWSNAQFAPFRARPLLSRDQQTGEFQAGGGCNADHFQEADFHPGWRWEKTPVDADWAKLSLNDPDLSVPPKPAATQYRSVRTHSTLVHRHRWRRAGRPSRRQRPTSIRFRTSLCRIHPPLRER
ncbi:MAG: hypothetical protein ACXW53_07210 [Candidatus Binatia bacterium]